MQHSYHFCFRVLVFLSMLTLINICHANNLNDEEKTEFFNSQVKPILQQNCFQCHGGGDEVEGGLELTSNPHRKTVPKKVSVLTQ